MFKGLNESDFASYSIMAGNTFGYDVFQFSIVERWKGNFFVTKLFVSHHEVLKIVKITL